MFRINCFNKVTMTPSSVSNPDAVVASDPDTFIKDPDMDVINSVDRVYWKIGGNELVEMDQAEKDVVDAARLPALKELRAKAIDVKTEELIGGGFDYDGVHFSLSDNAQKNWNRLYSMKLADKLIYPVIVSSADLSIQYELEDDVGVDAFYVALNTVIATSIGSGQALKLLVFAAITKAELDAIVDPR